MPSSTLGSTHSQTTSAVACNHRLWAAHMVEQRHTWHAIIALGRQTLSNDVRGGMPPSPLGSTNGRTMSGVTCHHSPWTTNTVKKRQACHSIIAFGQHKRSNDVGLGMTLPPLGTTHSRTHRAWHAIIPFGQHTRLNDVGRGMPSSPLDNKHDRQRWAWHDITAPGLHTQSATSGVA